MGRDTVILGAKADEGWKFTGWKNGDTDEMVSTEETIAVTVSQALHLTAVFEEDDSTGIHVSGGWNFSDQAYYSVNEENKAILESALTNSYNGTSTFEAVQVLASQSVAGANYAFLCKAEVTNISVFDIASYTTTEIVEPVDEPIRAEHTSITYGRNGDGIVINTTSKSDTVVIRIDGGTAATNETEGLTLENGTVKISKELANTLLKDGENKLNLVFSDGTLEVVIYVTGESSTITPGTETVKTGDTASAIAVSAAVLGSLTAALFLAMKRRKGEQE